MSKPKLFILLAVLLAAAIVIASFVFNRGEDEGQVVQIQAVEEGDLTVVVSAPGEIRAETRVSLSARTSAAITALPVEEGDAVVEGDVLVQLDDADAAARLRAAEADQRRFVANLSVAEARLTAARAATAANAAGLVEANQELERLQQLASTNDIARRDVDAAVARVARLRAQVEAERLQVKADEANLAALEAAVEASDAEIARAQENLSYTVIRSPIAGTVTKVNAEVGETVVVGTMNNAGTVILEVADLSEMICVAEVDEASVASVEVGTAASVRSAAYGDDVVLPGTVRSVALGKTAPLRSDDAAGYYEVEVLLDAAGVGQVRLFSGLTADVELVAREFQNVLVLPSQAIVSRVIEDLPRDVRDAPEVRQRRRETPVVYVEREGVARVVPVDVGDSDLLRTRILSGLSAGDRVITGPFRILDNLRDGQRVRDEAAESNDAD